MYIFKKTTTIKSEVCPGVEFVVRKMTENRRIELQMAVLGPNEKIRGLVTQANQLKAEDPEDRRNLSAILKVNDEMQHVITKELNPVKIRWGIVAVKGLAIGDENEPGTVDNLLEWPSDLVEEALSIIEAGAGMSEREAKNFGSAITFGEVMAARPASMTATPADATSAS